MLKKHFLLSALLALLVLILPTHLEAQGTRYVGNADSKIYHNSSCRYFDCKACTVRLSSPQEARQKGFRACKICKG